MAAVGVGFHYDLVAMLFMISPNNHFCFFAVSLCKIRFRPFHKIVFNIPWSSLFSYSILENLQIVHLLNAVLEGSITAGVES